mmetsp:Transcript_78682/g.138778  ORF Transcript_78682/g.138778 Transcript_78682/m.138778 type:complete len:260 (+) Transcript_78682:573-1352(+)
MLVVWLQRASAKPASSTCGQAKAKHCTSARAGIMAWSRQSAPINDATPAPNEWPQRITVRRLSTPSCSCSCAIPCLTSSASGSASRCAARHMPPWACPATPPSSMVVGSQTKSTRASLAEDVPLRATTTQPTSWSTATIYPGTKSFAPRCSKASTLTRPCTAADASASSAVPPPCAAACRARRAGAMETPSSNPAIKVALKVAAANLSQRSELSGRVIITGAGPNRSDSFIAACCAAVQADAAERRRWNGTSASGAQNC